MTSEQLAAEARRLERELVRLKADLYDRLVALEHVRTIQATAKAQEDQAAARQVQDA